MTTIIKFPAKVSKSEQTEDKTTKKASKFNARPGTMAICASLCDGDFHAGAVLLAILELWLNAKSKIDREHDGETKPFLFISAADLATISGRSVKQIQDRDIKGLKELTFLVIKTGKVKAGTPKKYQISVDLDKLWLPVMKSLEPFCQVEKTEDGINAHLGKNKLPVTFQRLFDRWTGGNPEVDGLTATLAND